jgi:hypothetical protein
MATVEKMTIAERYQYLRRMQPRYRAATKKEKGKLLDEMGIHTGLHRKSLLRLLGGEIRRQRRRRERSKEYGPEVDAALELIWKALDYICAERLTPNLVDTAELLARHQELQLSPSLRAQLARINVSTVRRHLPAPPLTHRRRKPAAPANRHQQAIPAYRIPRDIGAPGHFELDLVHHCGTQTAGEYVYTLQLIDVATGWSGRRAILGRSYLVVADALHYLWQRLPFSVLEVHPDNGSEFLNANVLTFLSKEYPQVKLSRSRPGQPNDNRLVEQKNQSLVRFYLGDRRLDTVQQTRFLNTIYAQLDDYYNYLQPVMKQIAKEWVPATATRAGYLKRRHDDAQPPALRLEAYLEAKHFQPVLDYRATLNPLQLRDAIYHNLDHLFAYPNAAPDEPQNVFQTLAHPDRFPAARAALAGVDTVDKHNTRLPTVPTPATTTTASQSSQKEAA